MALPMSALPTMKQVTDWIIYVLQTNQTIRQYCLDSYGLPPKIYLNSNSANPPTSAQCPFIDVIRDSHNGGFSPNTSSEIFNYFITACVQDREEGCEEDDGTIAALQTCRGMDNLEQLLYLIRNALGETLPQPMTVSEFFVQFTDVTTLELISGVIVVTINIPRHSGGCFPIPAIP